MAIWQHRLILIPEAVLLRKYDVMSLSIPMELAEDFRWWGDVQPSLGLERKIDLILPKRKSWSESMSMWGSEAGDDSYICYVDDAKQVVEEISFRIDARAVSSDFVGEICRLARRLGCVLMTSEYEILAPDNSMVLTNLNNSTARRFVADPAATLKGLNQEKMQNRVEYLMNRMKRDRPRGQ